MPEKQPDTVLIVLLVILGIGFAALAGFIVGVANMDTSVIEQEQTTPSRDIVMKEKRIRAMESLSDTPASPSSSKAAVPPKISKSAVEANPIRQFQYEESIAPERPVKMSIKEQIIEYPSDLLASKKLEEAYLPLPETTITNMAGGLTENPLAARDKNKRKKEGNALWLANALPSKAMEDKPMIAVVIDDMGVDAYHTNKVMEIGAPLTLAFLPYAPNVRAQAEEAREKGYELLIHVPMEPRNLKENNPGPGALLLKNTQADNVGRLKAYLNQMDGYVGINNHMGSAFTSSMKAMMPVIVELDERGLMFLDSRTSSLSKGEELAKLSGIPYAQRDVFLDHDPSMEGVVQSLEKLEAIALKYGTAIAIGHPKDNTIAALKKWIPSLKERGIQLVPLTAVTRHRIKINNKKEMAIPGHSEPDYQDKQSYRLLPIEKEAAKIAEKKLARYIADGTIRIDYSSGLR